MKNCNVANLNTDFKTTIKYWLEFTRPFHKLRNQEIEALHLFIYYYFKFKKDISNEDLLWKMVFDYDTKLLISEEMNIPTPTIANILSRLRLKNIIKNKRILKNYIPNIEYDSNSYKLMFNFTING